MRVQTLLLLICAAVIMSFTTAALALEDRSAEDKALITRVDKIIHDVQGTPGQESANFISGDSWVHNLYLQLRGDTTASEKQLVFARNMITSVADTAERGLSWKKPAFVKTPYATTAPIIDGQINDAIWEQALIFDVSYALNDTAKVTTPATKYRILWDNNNLYFAYECADKDIIAPKTEIDGILYNDDCVEVFLLPDFNAAKYWEIIINPAQSVFDALQTKLLDRWGPSTQVDANVKGMKVAYSIDGTLNKSDDVDKGYNIEVAIPFNQLPGYSEKNPAPGQQLYFLLARFDKTGKDMAFLYNQPVLSWGHNIWDYGQMELVK